MTERFLRAKTRLSQLEQELIESRKKLNQFSRSGETTKIPQIGEWELKQTKTQKETAKKINKLNKIQEQFKGRHIQPFPKDIRLSSEQKQRQKNPDHEIIQPFETKKVSEAPLKFVSTNITKLKKTNRNQIPNDKIPDSSTNIDSILASKYRTLPKPLPPLKDANEEIKDNSDTFLPLELFDNTAYDEFSVDYLLAHPKAWSKYSDMEQGETEWKECKAISYDPETFKFVIEWADSKKRKKVTRFNIRFEIENVEKFKERIEAAKRASIKYEMKFRFNSRIDSMSTEELPELSMPSLTTIVRMMNIPRNIKYEKLVNDLLNDADQKFQRMNNRLEFEYELEHNQNLPNRDDFLQFIRKPKKYNTSYGLVMKGSDQFKNIIMNISKIDLKANPYILEGIQIIHSILIKSQGLQLLNSYIEDPLELDEFVKVQLNFLSQSSETFKKLIDDAVENAVQATMNDTGAKDLDNDKVRLQKLMILTIRMLHTYLLGVVQDTLQHFLNFFNSFLIQDNIKSRLKISLTCSEKICIIPDIDCIKKEILSILNELEVKVSNLPVISIPLYDVNISVVSFQDCDQYIIDAKTELSSIIDKLNGKLSDFINNFNKLESYLILQKDQFVHDFDPDGKKSLDDYRKQLNEINAISDILSNQMDEKYSVSIFNIDCSKFKERGIEHTRNLNIALLNQLKEFAVYELSTLSEEFQTINEKIKAEIHTPEELSSLKDFIDSVIKTAPDREEKMNRAMERFAFLEEFKFGISNEEFQEKYQILQIPHKLKLITVDAKRTIQIEKIKMICELRQNQRQLEKDSLAVTELLPAFISKYHDFEMTIDACDEVNKIQDRIQDLKADQEKYNVHEKLLDFEPTQCTILKKLIDEFSPLYILWNLAGEWLTMNTAWLDTPFPQVRTDTMNSFMIQSTKKINKIKKDMGQYPTLHDHVLNPLIDQIEKFKHHLPLVAKLRHPGIKTKHWEMISEIVGFKVQPSMDLSLHDFISLDLERWNTQITEIANKAANEYNVESALDQMDNELQTQQFNSIEFRDSKQYILVDVNDIISLIDDQLVSTQTLLTSPFIAPNKKRALDRLSFLRSCHDILDQWVECQRGWLYLHPIFNGTSIQQKLHREARDWLSVNKIWNEIMILTHDHPDFVNVMHRDSLLSELKLSNTLLESITKGLNEYLESKRYGFPRFFFLSNDELIAILSHTKDFNQIQKSMNKLFEYIQTINVDEKLMITAMNDDGLESVEFGNPVNGDTQEVEDWLNAFEEEMKETLKSLIEKCLAESSMSKDKWIQKFPAQVILITNQILWTQKVTQSLNSKSNNSLMNLQQEFIKGLNLYTSLVRQKLTKSMRQVLSCLLINEVHNRDIISSLIKQEVSTEDSFKWEVQLRYYWEDDTVLVKSINNVFEYSYEYAGNSPRLVITPLTDRCYQTLLSAFKQNLSGAPSGPAGTGKTETVRDCAKSLGRPCVVYNCSEEVTPEQMSQFFAGLSSSGSWSCFDEFNRINIEVLSVIAQQVRTIQSAIASNLDTFTLDGRNLALNKNAAICITMNPGYAGRTELPDNLKALFRPCAMMVPDFVFISEILLFSGGFTNASSLATKLVALFDLCRTQLSKACHYDWGMRAMKSILTTAANLKRNDLDSDEALLLVNSFRDCTKPRLVLGDINLIDNIIHDVFPDVISEKKLPENIEPLLIKAFEQLNCQPLPIYLNKSYELFETTLLRHGLMLVGSPMGGKTTSWKAIQIAMCNLAKESKDAMPIQVETLNPKSISIPELYGLFDPITSGWSDGVLSSKIRDFSMSDQDKYRWIIADGPVDSLWIETMNSLLDDNKVLCLPNNERIALGNHVKMIFEVDDLSQASPATVSRCGMVYFDPSSLPYTSLIKSFLNTIESQALKDFLKEKLDDIVPKLIEFIEMKANAILGNNTLFFLLNMFHLMKCFEDILRKPIIEENPDTDDVIETDPLDSTIYFSCFRYSNEQKIPYINEDFSIFEKILYFSIIWSFGSNLDDDSRIDFSNFLLNESGNNIFDFQLTNGKTLFDYFFNFSTNKWEEWCDGVTGISINHEKNLENILIPTNKAAATLYISKLLIHHEYHMLLFGPESSKTLLAKCLMNDVLDKKFDSRFLPLSHCSTSTNVIKVLRSFMQKRHGCYGPLDNQKLVIFLDNLNSVKPEVFGAQPPLELIRQFFDYEGWYDTSKIEFQHVVDTTLIATMGKPGGGLYSISSRLLRHFFFVSLAKYRNEEMEEIIHKLLINNFSCFSDSISKLCPKIASASVEIYQKCSQNLLPIPGKSHYIFSLRNFIRVIKGMSMAQANELKDDNSFVDLWCNEMMKEFHNRFNTHDDRKWFVSILEEVVQAKLSHKFNENIIFADFLEGASSYHRIHLSLDEILSKCRDALNDHNRDSSKQLDIVIFQEAIDHIISIIRSLSMERGHSMLVGVKSSGRKSLARLSLYMSSMEVFEIQITRTYSFSEWRDDMKTLMKQCGSTDLPTGFMLSDTQIIGEFQLEDISNLLINGEIPNLYEKDEIEQIKAEIIQTEYLTNEDPWELFKARARKNLHIILIFSPYGTVFKDSILSYPALRTETTIDWYMPWSNDALESVADAALEKVEIDNSVEDSSIVNAFVKMHKSVESMSTLYYKEQKRFTACTPSRYFELISTFVHLLDEKRKSTREDISKYKNGVSKIKATRRQVQELGKQLDRDIPMLQEKRKEVKEMLHDLQVKKVEVEETQRQVKEQSQLAEIEAAKAKEANKVAQRKLATAQPILKAAQDAVDSIDKDSLTNIKTLKKIHPALRETFEAICIVFGRSPRKVETGVPGVKEDDYWPETLSLLNDIQFIRKVKMFEVEKLTRETINKLRKYVGANKKEREEKRLAVESGYQAAAHLYNWVCASYDFWFIYQEILPKKQQAEEAKAKLQESERILAEKQQYLQEVENQLQKLHDKYDEELKNESALAKSVDNTKLRLKRAKEIMKGLSGETKRWKECAKSLKESLQFILGDSLLISGSLTYLGVFGPTYRKQLLEQWKGFLKDEGIIFSDSFSISNALGNDPTIRDWIAKGLPNDSHSVENALIIENAKNSFPLLIDPQLSGTRWLLSFLGENAVILRFDQSDFIQRIRTCVQSGLTVIIENIGMKLDPLIEPILSREQIYSDGVKKISLGGEYVSYSDNFRLFLSTKYPNPQYSPEICSQVTLINFTTTQSGLTDLLMNNLIEVEQEDLDKLRIEIMEKNASNTKKLKEIENEILQIVSNVGSDILDDDNATNTLKNAQKTSAEIEEQMEASKKTEELISNFRNTYMVVAERAALLYFCASDFSVVDPMYQFSLKWFVSLFKNAISKTSRSDNTQELIHNLNETIAIHFYQNASFSLFSRHKLLFSTLLATRILVVEDKIKPSELAFLLSPQTMQTQKEIDFISDETWSLLVSLKNVNSNFEGIIESIKANPEVWKKYIDSTEPETSQIPLDNLTLFQKLLVLRVFHLHRVREGLRIFITEAVGKEFITPPPLNLANVFKESSPFNPIIFIITPGIDPIDEITGVATQMNIEKYLKCYSLGRGRGSGAEKLILDSAEKGFWVVLQNCHLSLSWMPQLEYLIDHMDPNTTSDRFRLCLVTMSTPEFPIGILYQGNKLIYEIPKGIRENMLRVYNGFNADEYLNDYSDIERRLTFHLAFYHSVVLERLQFGSIGWNIPYEFNPSDLMISRRHLRAFLTQSIHGDIPFEYLSYVIGELNYGGRVTDPYDRRLLLSLLNKYFCENVMKPGFTIGPRYPLPKFDVDTNLQDVLNILNGWPVVTEGVDVGLSENASTITARNDALSIFNSMIEIQPTVISLSDQITEEQYALNLVNTIYAEIPSPINAKQFEKEFDLQDTINMVLYHEVLLYNQLLQTIKESLEILMNGLKGLIVFDEKLELLNRRILANKVPEIWLEKSFPSILPLNNYINDIKSRIQFISQWCVTKERPKVFNLGAFYHPEEFITAILQVSARKHKIPFDSLCWSTIITNIPSNSIHDIEDYNIEDGIYVNNLFVEGAKFDSKTNSLVECGQCELISQLPIVHFIPREKTEDFDKQENQQIYLCPLYRMQNRGSGALGLPNHIMDIQIPVNNETPDHWIQRSVAAFLTIRM